MRLWTYQPCDFRVDDRQSPGIDPTQGVYWKDSTYTPCYQTALPQLCEVVGINYYPLWCKTVEGWLVSDYLNCPLCNSALPLRPQVEGRIVGCPDCSFTHKPIVEWQLDLPDSAIIAFIGEKPWHAIVAGTSQDWNGVIVESGVHDYISAIVPFPVLLAWNVKRNGPIYPPILRSWLGYARTLERVPKKRQQVEIAQDRLIASGTGIKPDDRSRALRRIAFLEEFLGLG